MARKAKHAGKCVRAGPEAGVFKKAAGHPKGLIGRTGLCLLCACEVGRARLTARKKKKQRDQTERNEPQNNPPEGETMQLQN